MTTMTRVLCGIGLAGAIQAAVASQPGKEEKPPLPKCPVMGEPVNLAISVATDDGPVFFCCKGCDKKYTADPGKYAALVAEQRKALAGRSRVQVKCPVDGRPVDPKVVSDKGGTRAAFCGKECLEKYDSDPGKYKSALANSYTFQVQCPVTGETIDPRSSVTLPDGELVYTCCKSCIKKLLNDSAKYAAELEKQGYGFRPDKLAKAVETPTPTKEEKDHRDEHDHDHDHEHEGHDHD